jgi:hypothetical protein
MYLSLANLQNTAEMLRDLDRDELADSLIGEYFDAHAGDPNLVRARHSAFISEIKDARLNDRLRVLWQTEMDKRTLAEVVKELTGRDGWDTEDIKVLTSHGADDYYKFFRSEHSDMLYLYVRTCLRFGEIANADDQYRDIAEKTKEALRRLAKESRINLLRVTAMYKIELEDNSTKMRADVSTVGEDRSSEPQ